MAANPIYQDPTWRAVQRHWATIHRTHTLHCTHCGITLRRGNPRGPDSLDIGHITDRHTAQALGWTINQINHISNTQPECQRCNRSRGAKLGNALRGHVLPTPMTSRAW